MTKEELREKLASMLLEALMFKAPEDKPLHEAIDDLLFSGPADTIRVTISVEGIDRSTLLAHDQATIATSPDHETMAVLCVHMRLDGKDSSQRCGGRADPMGNDYISTMPCADTPPK